MAKKITDSYGHGVQQVGYEKVGKKRLFTDPDADIARKHFHTKSRRMINKTTTLKEAVGKFVHNGCYFAAGGFGSNRIPVAVLHEIVRQKKKNLGFAAQGSTHDLQILLAGQCINRCDTVYSEGLKSGGISTVYRNKYKKNEIETTEWSNATLAWRFKAAAMGLSFLPARSLLGTDIINHSAAVEIPCPFTGKKYAALPALYPDVAAIHVHRSDIYGNCHIMGIAVSDLDLARAAKKLIITAEKIIHNDEIRQSPDSTAIPYYLVDAVIEVPYGAYPSNMPYKYFTDEDHLMDWMKTEQNEDDYKRFIDKNIYNCANHWDYLNINGGLEHLNNLRALETLTDRR